ncbi:MAG: hypothetical protein R2748_28150 [Bryobacterales bacterium]
MPDFKFSPTHDHERTDAHVKPLVIFLIAMGVTIVGSFISMVGLFDFLSMRAQSMDRVPSSVKVADEVPSGPRLQVVPGLDLREIRAAEEDRLNGYGWVDEGGRVVHIPIEKAIDVLIERGVPARSE